MRVGAYPSESHAQSAAQSLGGTVVGTSSYGVNATRTGSTEILGRLPPIQNQTDAW